MFLKYLKASVVEAEGKPLVAGLHLDLSVEERIQRSSVTRDPEFKRNMMC